MSIHLGSMILHRYLCSPYMWHISSDSGRTFQALSARDAMGQLLIQIMCVWVYALTALALFVTLLSATPAVILGAVLTTAFIAALLYNLVKRQVDQSGKDLLKASQAQTTSLMNAINGIREVLIYRQQPVFYSAYLTACREGARPRSFLTIASQMPTWVLECLGIGVIPFSIWVLSVRGDVSLTTVVVVISLVMLTAWRILPMVTRSLSVLIAVRSLRPQAMTSLEVFEEMRKTPTVELPDPDPDFCFEKSIGLDHVSFRYPTAGEDALKDITLSVPKGSQVGFIGLSGAGKSTIVGIFSGLFEPREGDLLIDGHPMNREQRAAYMPRVGYVPQTPYIMAGTIAGNVAFSEWGKPYDRERVERACRMAALDLVERGDGIDTVLGERGAGLSGGQAQRVSIARALYCNPEILILDESTSSLDQANENAIMQTINTWRGKITTIIVAHRLTTLENCDYIFWLESGRLVGHGPALEMLARYRAHLEGQKVKGRD